MEGTQLVGVTPIHCVSSPLDSRIVIKQRVAVESGDERPGSFRNEKSTPKGLDISDPVGL